MRILAIETSCDDTAVAIVENGTRVLISKVASQEKLHARFGGVVPEVASREHIKAIYPLIDAVLKETGLRPKDIDALAVTVGPGLLGSLMVGVNAARTLGYLWKKPVVPVDHLQGHFYSAFLTDPKIKFPVVALIVSGGHTELVLAKKHGDYQYLGGTIDDAAGEAFDKVARMLDLGYPGGPAVGAAAAKLKMPPEGVFLPRPMLDRAGLDFSFSGLKTAVSRVKGRRDEEIAYEFQRAVAEILTGKLIVAVNKFRPATVVLGGGVTANTVLRQEAARQLSAAGVPLVVAEPKYCTDNAAMIAAAAYFVGKPQKASWEKAKVRL